MIGRVQAVSPVPTGLTELSTTDGRQMLRNSTPNDQFWLLAQEFTTQDSQDWCGLASASMVLNALPIPKPAINAFEGYPYFYQDNILKTSKPKVMTASEVAKSGLGLDDITDILNAHVGVEAEALHTDPGAVSLDQFRQSIADAMAASDTYLIANFDRYEFMGEGGGHHSPLGAYCAESDTVLILDVARYRFKPYWVPVEKMYNATASSNGLAQGGHRGLARVTAQQGSANLATPPHYESDTLRSESDDTASIQSDATSDNTPSSTAQRGSSNWAGAVAGILLAFCVGAIVGAVAYRGHEQHVSPLDTHSSELVEQHRLLNQQSSLSQNQNL
ncbi:hypothetical protein WJX77_011527 [Trebouxia sp. C0004]